MERVSKLSNSLSFDLFADFFVEMMERVSETSNSLTLISLSTFLFRSFFLSFSLRRPFVVCRPLPFLPLCLLVARRMALAVWSGTLKIPAEVRESLACPGGRGNQFHLSLCGPKEKRGEMRMEMRGRWLLLWCGGRSLSLTFAWLPTDRYLWVSRRGSPGWSSLSFCGFFRPSFLSFLRRRGHQTAPPVVSFCGGLAP
jgi:hypothetical protein